MVRDLAVLESLNQQVLDALPSGILFCDTDYIVRRVNACYAALLGGKVSSILGRPLTELNPATRAPIVIKRLCYSFRLTFIVRCCIHSS